MSNHNSNNYNQPHRFDREMALSVIFWIVVVAIVLGGTIGGYMFIKPRYSVWSAQMQGEAELAQAEGNRRIAVLEAEAKLEAAKSLAAAEVERARGVAQANAIIGESLRNNESYLRYL